MLTFNRLMVDHGYVFRAHGPEELSRKAAPSILGNKYKREEADPSVEYMAYVLLEVTYISITTLERWFSLPDNRTEL